MARRFGTYLSPDGTMCVSYDQWKIYREENAYEIRKFENGRVSLKLMAADTVQNASNIPREHWKMFKVDVANIVTESWDGSFIPGGKRVIDIDASKSFRTREEAEQHYNRFLAKYTESHFDDESGELVEVGNIFTPPNPDIPTVMEESSVASEFGSW